METLATMIMLLFGVLIVGGLVVNVYFYSRGVFKPKCIRRATPLESVILSQEVDSQGFYMNLGASSTEMDIYIRKALVLLVGSLVGLSLLMVLIATSVGGPR